MKRFRKIWRLFGLSILIILACFGIGIAGGAPIPSPRKKEDSIELKVELPDTERNTKEIGQFNKQR
jgi:hypothetical protein